MTAPRLPVFLRILLKRMHGGRTTCTLEVHIARIVPPVELLSCDRSSCRTPDLCCASQTHKETLVRGTPIPKLLPKIDPVGRPELFQQYPF